MSLETGKIHTRSQYMNFEGEEELPDDLYDPVRYISLPDKHDLNLGTSLVWSFVDEYSPSDYDRVRAMFRKRGAYAKFKDWADCNDLLETWYRFEEEATKKAAREWCEENDLHLVEK
ncbi:UPF0158 family protein [Methylotuvimicrobium sp. KM1]|uniref:UPF0158 family protein n=1 Tax=Methylotuvimicrobium sp. KM1 TaxID=3377707 RepID=UPI0038505FAC